MARWGRLATVLQLLAANGCAFLGLSRQLQELSTWGRCDGVVASAAGSKALIYTVLLHGPPAAERVVAVDTIPSPGGPYALFMSRPVADGPCRVFAFEDVDGDGRYTPGEPCAVLDRPTFTAAERGPGTAGNQLTLRAGSPASPPGVTGDVGASIAAAIDALRTERICLATLADPRFDADVAARGVYEPKRFMQADGGMTLYTLEPIDPARTPVIFVHGMNGSPRNFRAMIAGLDRSRFQAWAFYWPTGMPVELSGMALNRFLDDVCVRYRFDHCDLVAHSMGGLVCQHALNLRARDGRPAVVRDFVTFSTPWGGDPAAGMGVAYSPVVVPSWRSMAPGQPFLSELFDTPPAATVRYTLFFTRGDRAGGRQPGTDGVVSLASMLRPAARARASWVQGFDDEHTAVLDDPAAAAMLNERLGVRGNRPNVASAAD